MKHLWDDYDKLEKATELCSVCGAEAFRVLRDDRFLVLNHISFRQSHDLQITNENKHESVILFQYKNI